MPQSITLKLRLLSVRLAALFCLTCCADLAYSQNPRAEKRIYLLDVTGSMEGKDDAGAIDIFAEVKEKLANAVLEIESDNGEVVVIPFTSKTHNPIRGGHTMKRIPSPI